MYSCSQAVSSLDGDTKRLLLEGLGADPLAQAAYRPMLELMGARAALF